MAAMVPDAMSGVQAARDANLIRAEALVAVRAKAERGDFTHALSDLLRDALGSRPLLRLHIWRVEQAAFDNRTATCKRHARIAAGWCGVDGARAGSLTLAWLLDERTGGARLAAWLPARMQQRTAAWTCVTRMAGTRSACPARTRSRMYAPSR